MPLDVQVLGDPARHVLESIAPQGGEVDALEAARFDELSHRCRHAVRLHDAAPGERVRLEQIREALDGSRDASWGWRDVVEAGPAPDLGAALERAGPVRQAWPQVGLEERV